MPIAVPGITFYLQPVQDLTIDSVVSRAQYQFVLQAATSAGAQRFRAQAAGRSCSKRQALRNVSTSFLDKGLSAYLKVDRDTAARFGITAATIDNALYDSFGQRIISTIFTQSNQYRVILEADPKLQNSVASLNDIYLPSPPAAARCRFRPSPRSISAPCRCRSIIWASSPPPPSPSMWRRAIRWARRWMRSRQAEADAGTAARHHHPVRRLGAGLPVGAGQRSAADHRRHHHRLYRAGRAV